MGAQTGGAVEGVDGAAHALRSALLALTGLLDWEEVGRTGAHTLVVVEVEALVAG